MKLTSSNKPGLGKVGSSPLTRSPIRWHQSPIRLEHPSYGTTLYRSRGVGGSYARAGALHICWKVRTTGIGRSLSAHGNVKWPTWNSTGVHVKPDEGK